MMMMMIDDDDDDDDFQRISVMIQRFNAVAFRGTFATLDLNDE